MAFAKANAMITLCAALLLPAHATLLRGASRPGVLSRVAASRGSSCVAAASGGAEVLFVVPEAGASPFGATSPEPAPEWLAVAQHLASRMPGFDTTGALRASVLSAETVAAGAAASKADVVVVLGVRDAAVAPPLQALTAGAVALVAYDCADAVAELQRIGEFKSAAEGVEAASQAAAVQLMPWAGAAQGSRLAEQAELLFSRHSSEDLLYAVFFIVHALVQELDIVRHTVSPTWEKGPLRNAQEFAAMCTTCSGEISAALSDPPTKATIDLLNACDMRDQVGSYRVIVSYETPQLEDFSLCILQKNNLFGCDAPILEQPRVPLLRRWRGQPVDAQAARELFIGHYACDEAHATAQRLPWSWKIVCGANPAYDAFPAQHQIFYPSGKSATALWYDPVFKVETLDGRSVWTKRHYRCTPREVAAEVAGEGGSSAGAWTLTTLDNGVISKEHWTTVDAADDLSWAVFHYSGAAAVVGQSYLGALLCSADGTWPADAVSGPQYERIVAAFRTCGIEMWELYGHGPPKEATSFMWTAAHAEWEASNPPPLEPIGDQTVQAWRKAEKEKAAGEKVPVPP